MTSTFLVNQDPGLAVRTKSGNWCEGRGLLARLQQVLYQWPTTAQEAEGQVGNGLELRPLTDLREFIKMRQTSERGPGTLG